MTTPELTAAARIVAEDAAQAYENAFADQLVATYLLGSLSYGGYAPAVSDIDLAVILSDRSETDPETIQTTSDTLRAKDGPYRKLSVFWASLPALRNGRDDGRFPALDRLELAAHGTLLHGNEVAPQVARPGSDELLLESAEFAIDILAADEVIAEFHHPRRLLADPVWFTKAVLFPLRFLYTNTRTTPRSAPNDEAIAWYLAQPDATAPSLVRLAERVRAGHPLDPGEVAPELAAGLVPLYQHYIDKQTPLLRHANAPADLVTAFAQWGQRLSTP